MAYHAEDDQLERLDRLDRERSKDIRPPLSGPSAMDEEFRAKLDSAWPMLRRLAREALKFRDHYGAVAD
jgi:hypothetical protein